MTGVGHETTDAATLVAQKTLGQAPVDKKAGFTQPTNKVPRYKAFSCHFPPSPLGPEGIVGQHNRVVPRQSLYSTRLQQTGGWQGLATHGTNKLGSRFKRFSWVSVSALPGWKDHHVVPALRMTAPSQFPSQHRPRYSLSQNPKSQLACWPRSVSWRLFRAHRRNEVCKNEPLLPRRVLIHTTGPSLPQQLVACRRSCRRQRVPAATDPIAPLSDRRQTPDARQERRDGWQVGPF